MSTVKPTLNEVMLRNLRAELELALAYHKILRTSYLLAEIAKLEKLTQEKSACSA